MNSARGSFVTTNKTGRRRRKKPLGLSELYDRLFAAYGEQHWWPGETPFEVMVGAILTQNTAWTNVEKAISALREDDALNPEALRTRPIEDLAALIRPSGYFNAKARKLRALGECLAGYDDDIERLFASKPLDELREELSGLSTALGRRRRILYCSTPETCRRSSSTPTPSACWVGWALSMQSPGPHMMHCARSLS